MKLYEHYILVNRLTLLTNSTSKMFIGDKDKKYRVLVYSDAAVYGGHEITLLSALSALTRLDNLDVLVIVNQVNVRFLEQLACLDPVPSILPVTFATQAGDVFRVLFRSAKVREISRTMMRLKPDVVIVSQGAIALSACGLGAAKIAGLRVISFLPMAHAVALVRGFDSMLVRIQEFLYRFLYKIPDDFITICLGTKRQLVHCYNVPEDSIQVCYYGLDLSSLPKSELCRTKPTEKTRHIGIIGRIEFNQKRQDFFVRALAANKEIFERTLVHIVGDGPDLETLKEIVLELQIENIVKFEGWSKDMTQWYRNLDLIVLPSRFEGFPLVMIEAMYWGIPIVASDVDGMQEILPAQWLFPEGDAKEMLKCIHNVLSQDQCELVEKNHRIVLEKLNVKKFQDAFCESLNSCLYKIAVHNNFPVSAFPPDFETEKPSLTNSDEITGFRPILPASHVGKCQRRDVEAFSSSQGIGEVGHGSSETPNSSNLETK